MSHRTQIVVVDFENRIADTAPWNLCGCDEHEPERLKWVRYFQEQHDQLYAEQQERERGADTDPLGEDFSAEHYPEVIPLSMGLP
jgi:hypothetical protein